MAPCLPHSALTCQPARSLWVTQERGQGCTVASDSDLFPHRRDSELLAGETAVVGEVSQPMGSGWEFFFNHLLPPPLMREGFHPSSRRMSRHSSPSWKWDGQSLLVTHTPSRGRKTLYTTQGHTGMYWGPEWTSKAAGGRVCSNKREAVPGSSGRLWSAYLNDSVVWQEPKPASVQFSSVAQLCPTLCDPMDCSMPGLPVHHQLPEFTQTHVHWAGDAIQPSHPLLLPSILPSIRVFSNESVLHIRWPKDWNFSFNISPSNEHSGLISFRMDWLDLLAVQGTLKSLLQHHSLKASILWCSAFFIVQLSHPYMTTRKTIALTRRTFVDKVMSLLFNMLSRLVITFFPRSKCLLISWLQSPSAVILEPQNTKNLLLRDKQDLHLPPW